MLRLVRRGSDAPRREVLYDRLGRPRTPVTVPGAKAGQRPPNYGRTYPAEVLTPAEVHRLIDACSKRGAGGLRNRALIVVLWRAGLRIKEALDLELRDIDRQAGTILVRHGKGNRRRVVAMDPAAFAVLEQWLERRKSLGVPAGSRVFCSITRPSVGQPMSASAWRDTIKQLGRKAGIEKRVHSHGLRHTCAAEMHREGIPMLLIQLQLGHNDLRMTAHYVNHLEPGELIARIQQRAWPSHEPSSSRLLASQAA